MSSISLRIVLVVAMVGGLAACGDSAMPDGGNVDACASGCHADAGMDAGPGDAGHPDLGPIGMDAGSDSGVNLAPCDATATTDSCGAGMHCAVTLHASPIDGGLGTFVLGECVPQPATHLSLGSTCSDFPAVSGIAGLRADPCGDGLLCWNNPDSTIQRCQPFCIPGTHPCTTPGQFCIGLNGTDLPSFGACGTATNCNPLTQDCASDQGCYLVPDDTGALYSSCFPVQPLAIDLSDGGSEDAGVSMAGGDCGYFGNCEPGTQCVNVMLADGGVQGICRSICDTSLTGGTDAGTVDAGDVDAGDVDAGDVDAGTPTDAGAAPRTCTVTGETCMPFMGDAPDAAVVVTQPVGYCM